MDRRAFLQLSTISAGVGLHSWSRANALGSTKPAISVISDITDCTPAAHLQMALDIFSEFALPVSCVFDSHKTSNLPDTTSCKVADILRNSARAQSNLVEIVGFAPELARQSDYFQARSCYSVRQALSRGGSSENPGQTSEIELRSIACRDIENPTSPGGVRSAGIRNVIMLSESSKNSVSQDWDNGVLRLIGGQQVDLTKQPESWITQGNQQEVITKIISASKIAELSLAELSTKLGQYCQSILNAEMSGQASNILLRELQLQDDYNFERMIAVVLGVYSKDTGSSQPEIQKIKNDLKALNIPFTEQDLDTFGTQGTLPGLWVTTEDMPKKTAVEQPVISVSLPPNCAQAEKNTSLEVSAPTGNAGIMLALNQSSAGVNDCGQLAFPVKFAKHQAGKVERVDSGLFRQNDHVLLISTKQTSTRLEHTQMLKMLKTLKNDGITKFVDIPNLVNHTVPRGAQVSRVRKTQFPTTSNKASHDSPSNVIREAFMKDANIAWQYFKKFTHPKTGLCPATVNFSRAEVIQHLSVTMWDVGSNINALVAAAELGFITKKDLKRRAAKIIPNLRGRESQGRLLPQGWIRSDRHKWGNKNFDGCDCGRLLAALDNLRRFTGKDETIEKIVESWDLDKIIIDGAVHSVTDGALTATNNSQCSHYLSIAFGRWGLDVKSPLDLAKDLSPTDQKVAVVEQASRLGILGAEPLLLEALELGMSQQSDILANVLFDAQLEEYRQSGTLTCMSESPIDRSPWFTYQGIQLDALGRKWSIDVVGGLSAGKKTALLKEVWVVSSKAAFLWAACRPHQYSDILVNFVRDKARGKYGFASSTYVSTGKASRFYTDLNTNSIILQSIAHLLRDKEASKE